MSSLLERSSARRNIITMQKVNLHSLDNHSFHIGLDVESSWELLAKISKEAWIEKTGEIPPSTVDKLICKFIRLKQRT